MNADDYNSSLVTVHRLGGTKEVHCRYGVKKLLHKYILSYWYVFQIKNLMRALRNMVMNLQSFIKG
jgi:hypothetical protein